MVPDQVKKADKKKSVLIWLVLVLVTAACMVPFCGKAFHIDDPLFLWAAQHIQSNPGNPYNFSVNWSGVVLPMWIITKNPPLNCYFIAGVAHLAGWSEKALHLAFLIPALAAILGTYCLAGCFCKRPLIAALLTLFSPAFLVSGATVMCDVLMLALWIWAVVFWVQGIEKDNSWRLILAAILVALSALTKYYGMSLIPLLAIYAIFNKRRLGWRMAYLLIPAAILAWYQSATYMLYGRGLLMDAGEFVVAAREGYGATIMPRTAIGLAFIGGSFLATLAYSFFLWSKKRIVLGVICIGIVMLIISSMGKIGVFSLANERGETQWLIILQISIFAVAGIGLAELAVAEVLKHPDADTILLSLWIIGTMGFAAYVNWTVNVRSILPLIPAASILLMRRLEDSDLHPKQKKAPTDPTTFYFEWRRLIFPMIPLALLALLVAHADFVLAGSARTAAAQIRKQYSQDRIFFEGHWGFQYYMESLGGKAINFQDARDIASGDLAVIPVNNPIVDINLFPEEVVLPLPELQFDVARWLTTMHPTVGAGFYADIWGPLPYAFGAVPPERYLLYRVKSLQQSR